MQASQSRLITVRHRLLPWLAAILLLMLLLWVLLLPAESSLGNLIKLVFVHGALVWVGLATFSLAGVLGAAALLLRRPHWYRGGEAAGRAAILLWVVYAASSVLVTRLAWGQFIAWNEPRVQATGLILVAAIVLALVVRLVDNYDFSALVAIAMGVLPWVIVQRAEAIRHPIDPIGSSGSSAMQTYYLLIVGTVAGLAALLVAYLWLGKECQSSGATTPDPTIQQ